MLNVTILILYPYRGIMIPMNTRNKLEEALKDAMRSHDELSKRTLRMALSAIRQIENDKGKS